LDDGARISLFRRFGQGRNPGLYPRRGKPPRAQGRFHNCRSTLEQYLHVLVYLFQHRDTIDYALEREIDAHALDQSVSAWEQMLSAPDLGGRAGQEVLAKRPAFAASR